MLLEKLISAFGVSGYEKDIRSVIREEIKELADEITVDALGNLIVYKSGVGKNKKKIMASAHMDEIGFQVVKIEDKGNIRVRALGGIPVIGTSMNRVKFRNGIIGLVASTIKEKELTTDTKKLYIDIGASSKEEAEKIAAEKGFTFVEDAGRGYRRVVASPQPQKIVELETVKQLVEQGTIVITVGGGGIPVVEESDGSLRGVAAVIDKDKSSAKLAKDLDAEMLVILTAVDRVCINFNKPNQEELSEINLEKAGKYIQEGHFAKGSMLPKVEACMDYVKFSNNGKALITSLEKAKEALHGITGTIIEK